MACWSSTSRWGRPRSRWCAAIRRLLARARGPAGARELQASATAAPWIRWPRACLPVCVGEGTKLAPFLLDADKRYEATVRFGVETDTLDAAGKVVATAPVEGAGRMAAAGGAAGAVPRGRQQQVPAHVLGAEARGPAAVRLRPRGPGGRPGARGPITVHELVLEAWIPPSLGADARALFEGHLRPGAGGGPGPGGGPGRPPRRCAGPPRGRSTSARRSSWRRWRRWCAGRAAAVRVAGRGAGPPAGACQVGPELRVAP